jgi:3-oxoacyl-[acyl-carrier protein] reductase
LAATLALELAAHAVRVNAVSPGSFLADGNTGWSRFRADHPDEFARFVEEEFPFGRLGLAEEIADVITFLLSPRASWINGTNVVVDGLQRRPTARRFPYRQSAT